MKTINHYLRCLAILIALAIPASLCASESHASATVTAAQQQKQGKAKKQGGAKKGNKGKKGKKGKKKSMEPEKVKTRYYALKVNVPYAAAVVQNLEFEAQVARKWSVAVPVMWSLSDLTNDHGLRTVALQPEARWWVDGVGNGHIIGFHANLAWYNLKWNDTRYQGRDFPLLGAGISYAYRFSLSARWGAEIGLGVGYAYLKYDTYYNIENGALRGRGSRHYFGPDRLNLSLVYRF